MRGRSGKSNFQFYALIPRNIISSFMFSMADWIGVKCFMLYILLFTPHPWQQKMSFSVLCFGRVTMGRTS